MSKKGKTISLFIVMAMVVSLLAVIPLALAGADDGTNGDHVEFISFQDLAADSGGGAGDVQVNVDFVSTQFGTSIFAADSAFNLATIKATVPDDNEVLAVVDEVHTSVGTGFTVTKTPIVDLDGDGIIDPDDVSIFNTTDSVFLFGEVLTVNAGGAITLANQGTDNIEIDYGTSEIDSTSVEVTSDSEPTSAEGLAIEFDFDDVDLFGSPGDADSNDFAVIFLLLTKADIDAIEDVIDDDPLGSGVDTITELIADVAALLDGAGDGIELSGFDSGGDWITAAEAVVMAQELVATLDPDVELTDVVSFGDKPDDFFNLTLEVADQDEVTATVGTATATDTVLADLVSPVIEIIGDVENGDHTNRSSPEIRVSIKDAGFDDDLSAGIPLGDLADLVNYWFDEDGPGGGVLIEQADGHIIFSATADGWKATLNTGAGGAGFTPLVTEGVYTWGVEAWDAVGNAAGDKDAYTFKFDITDPTLASAVTGLGVSDGAEGSDADGILAEFDDSMDSASLDEDDFDVTGFSPPDAAAHFDTLTRTDVIAGIEGDHNYDLAEPVLGLDSDGDPIDADTELTDLVSVLITRTEYLDNGIDCGDGTDAPPAIRDDGDDHTFEVGTDDNVDVLSASVWVDNVPFEVDTIGPDEEGDIELVTLVDPAPDGSCNVVITFTFAAEDFHFHSDTEIGLDDSSEIGDSIAVTYDFDASRFVYLTVEGLDPAAEPDLSVVADADGVDDLAGNTEDDIEDFGVKDKIAPTPTITIGSLIADGEELTILIETDEDLDVKPDVFIRDASLAAGVDNGPPHSHEEADNFTEVAGSLIDKISDSEYKLTVIGGNEDDYGLHENGFVHLRIQAEDENGNKTTVNLRGFDGLEVDLGVNDGVAPLYLSSGGGLADGDPIFQGLDNIIRIEVHFDEEAGEYTGDDRPGVTATSALLGWNTIELVEGPDLGTGSGGLGQSGTATLTAVGDKTRVDISVTAGISGIQHIHAGTSSAVGAVVYGLGTIGADGTSSTLVDVPIDDLRTGDFVINLHDATDPSIYTANGTIPVPQDLVPVGFDASDAGDGHAWGFATPLPVGEYSYTLAVEDEAGNTWSDTIAFKVEPPTAFEIPIEPGWNLISVPSRLDAATPAKVFGPDRPGVLEGVAPSVTKIRTWSQAAGWEISNFKDGAWEGDILALRPGTGYWVFSENADDASVVLRRIAGLPPAPAPQAVIAGWNLLGPQFYNLPVEEGEFTPAATYWGAGSDLDANPWYSFDGVTQEFSRNDGDLEAGKGYWVYAPADGQIVQ